MRKRIVKSTMDLLHFNRWSGTSVGVFRSIGRVVMIGILPVIYTMAAFTQGAIAQQPSQPQAWYQPEQNIDSVIVESVSRQISLSQNREMVRVVTIDGLNLPAVISLQELLAQIPGFDIQTRGPKGIQADITMRGGTFDQVLVLLNGMNMSDAQTGHLTLNMPIRPEAIDYIEVLTGPGARLYGPGAYAGAINIVTKQVQKTGIELQLQGGQYSLLDGYLGATIRQGPLSIFSYASGGSSNGYKHNSDYVKFNALSVAQLTTRYGNLDVQLGHVAKDFGANTFYGVNYPDQFEAIKSSIASARYSYATRMWKASAMLSWRSHRDRFELFREKWNASWYNGPNYHYAQSIEGRVMGQLNMAFSSTSLSLITRHENILSTVLGKKLDHAIAVPGFTGKGFKKYTHYGERTNVTLALEETMRFGGFSVSLGGNATYNQIYRWAFGYGLDMSYSWENGLRLYLAANNAYRQPTFTDLYYNVGGKHGNPNLHPEEAFTFEGGTTWGNQLFALSASAYYRLGREIIDWVQDPSDPKQFHATNHAKLNAYGFDFNGGYYPRLPYLRSLTLSYAYNGYQKPDKGSGSASYALNSLQHQATLTAVCPIWKLFDLTAQVQYTHRNGKYIEFGTKMRKEYPHSVILNLRFERAFRNFTLFLDVENVLGSERLDFGEVPLPRCWISGGIKYSWHR